MTDTTRDLIQRLADELDTWLTAYPSFPARHYRYGVDLLAKARAYLSQPEPEGLPPDYIDSEHTGHDREMLEEFYRACRSEGGSADEIYLRGLKAVIALAQPEPEGLTDEELLAVLTQAVASFPPMHPEAKALSVDEYDWELEARKARALIAADRARWGRTTTTQEALPDD